MEKTPTLAITGDVQSGASFDAPFFPFNGADSVDLSSDIWIRPNSLRLSVQSVHSVIVSDSLGITIPGSTTFDGIQVRFTPKYELKPGMRYNVAATFQLSNVQDDGQPVPAGDGSDRSLTAGTEYTISWRFTARKDYSYNMRLASQSVTNLPRDGNKVMQMGDYLYSYGGWSAIPYGTYNDVYRSNGDLSHWTKLADAPWAPRHTFGIGKIDSVLYIFGGDFQTPKFDVWKSYDGEHFIQVQQDLNGLLRPRILYGACVHRSKLYVVGGQDGPNDDQGLTDVWSSTNGSFWRRVANDLPFVGQNNAGSLTSFAGRLWLIGGGYYHNDSQKRTFKNTVFSSSNGVDWIKEKDAPWQGRQFADVVVWNRRLWMIGGANPYNNNDIWYMTEDGEWHQLETPAEFSTRHAAGVGVYNDQLVIVCGNEHNDCWVISKG